MYFYFFGLCTKRYVSQTVRSLVPTLKEHLFAIFFFPSYISSLFGSLVPLNKSKNVYLFRHLAYVQNTLTAKWNACKIDDLNYTKFRTMIHRNSSTKLFIWIYEFCFVEYMNCVHIMCCVETRNYNRLDKTQINKIQILLTIII